MIGQKRRREEFYCDEVGGGCGCYFLTYLRENMFGNYTIECPSCKHHHFRVIDQGLVTRDRHNERFGEAEVIVGLASTVSKTPYHDCPEFRRAQLRVYRG